MTRNITIRINEDLAKQARVLAARRDTSISAMVAEILEKLVARESTFQSARKKELQRMKKGYTLGTRGMSSWSREDLHER